MGLFVDVIGAIAAATFLALLLSPAPSTLAIYRAQATGVAPFSPLVVMFVNSWIWLLYAVLQRNIFPLLVSNVIGVVVAFGYVGVFYRFTPTRSYANKVLAIAAIALIVITIYTALGASGHTGQTRGQVENVLGYLGNATVIMFFASPLENVKLVLTHRSGVFIPIFVVGVGAANAVAWIVYSLLTTDWYLFVPNTSALALASIQIVLYAVFHPSSHPYNPQDEVVGHEKDLEAAYVDAGACSPAPESSTTTRSAV